MQSVSVGPGLERGGSTSPCGSRPFGATLATMRSGLLGATILWAASPSCCVAAQVLVETVDGVRPAGQLRVGDLVWSVDPATGRRVAVRVVLVRTARRECLGLTHAHGELVCTPDHPLYSPERVAYRPASDWISGDARTLLVIDGHGAREAPVRARAVNAGTYTVIDVSVDGDLHNFVAAGVVVHNKSFAYPAAIEDGPAFELTADEPVEELRVRVCYGDDDAPVGLPVGILFQTSLAQVPLQGVPWVAGYAAGGDDTPFYADAAVPHEGLSITLETRERSCSDGVVFVIERVDTLPDGVVSVAWTAVAGGTENTDESIHVIPE